jgi:hypothetical protein
MKLLLTLTTICLSIGISFAAVVVDGTSKEEDPGAGIMMASQHPTHIVKLRAASIKNITGKFLSYINAKEKIYTDIFTTRL